MLLQYGARNFFCFKEGININLELGDNVPENISKGKSYANILCVKGANASGKTNALKILSFLNHFCVYSFKYEDDRGIPVDPFFYSEEPIDFFVDFDVDGIRYKYELTLDEEKVIKESVTRTAKRSTCLFVRQEDKVVKAIAEFKSIKNIKLPSNSSIISAAHYHNDIHELNDFYNFFNGIISNVKYSGLMTEMSELSMVSEALDNNKNTLDFVQEFIKNCDLGIEKIIIRESEENKGTYYPLFYHTGQQFPLTFNFESNGTRTLFMNLMYYLSVWKIWKIK